MRLCAKIGVKIVRNTAKVARAVSYNTNSMIEAQGNIILLILLIALLGATFRLGGERPSGEEILAPPLIFLRVFIACIVLALGAALLFSVRSLCTAQEGAQFVQTFIFACKNVPIFFIATAITAIIILRGRAQ